MAFLPFYFHPIQGSRKEAPRDILADMGTRNNLPALLVDDRVCDCLSPFPYFHRPLALVDYLFMFIV
jgi:hypothetical protein